MRTVRLTLVIDVDVPADLEAQWTTKGDLLSWAERILDKQARDFEAVGMTAVPVLAEVDGVLRLARSTPERKES